MASRRMSSRSRNGSRRIEGRASPHGRVPAGLSCRLAPALTYLSPLKRDEIWMNRHCAFACCLGMTPRVKPEGMLSGKPLHTLPDHVLKKHLRRHAEQDLPDLFE